MFLKFYNFLTRKKELFKPLRASHVGLYTCGPTVYNFAHIGNLRTYIFEDIMRRILEYAGHRVRHVMNITDVEDKIIRDAAKAGKNISEFTAPYERAFFEDLKKLNIEAAWKYPAATTHIPEMIALIQKLLNKGIAYESDGSIYFSIKKFKNYGKLSRVGTRTLKIGARVDADEYTKDSAQDFVLWKAAKPGEPSWDASFGRGRPGWHIECSAMSMKYLGQTFDIHAGGVDLIFPHHENEIAQSEGATGKPFVRFFVEGEHLLVNGEKMSKSLGNIFTLRDIEKRGFDPLAFRYLVLTAHYRSKLNFTWKSLAAAQESLERLREFMQRVKKQGTGNRERGTIQKTKKEFGRALSDDLNTPKALAALWGLVRKFNKNPNRFDRAEAARMMRDADRVLGLGLKTLRPQAVPPEIKKLGAERSRLRAAGQWEAADRIRKDVEARGWRIEDAPEGPRLKKLPAG